METFGHIVWIKLLKHAKLKMPLSVKAELTTSQDYTTVHIRFYFDTTELHT